MDHERRAWITLARVAADGAALAALWLSVVALRSTLDLAAWMPLKPFSWALHAPLLALVIPAWMGALALRGWYRRGGAAAVVGGVVLALIAFQALLFALKLDHTARSVVYGFAVLAIPTLSLTRRFVNAALARWFQARPARLLAVGAEGGPLPPGLLVGRLGEGRGPGWLGPVSALSEVLGREAIDEVVIASPLPREVFAGVAACCEEHGTPVTLVPAALGLRASLPTVRDHFSEVFLTFRRGPGSGAALAAKRLADLLGAAALLTLAAPLLVLLGAAVRIQDGGPALFRQTRVGRAGRTFTLYKLRTMRVDAPALRAALEAQNDLAGPAFKMRLDPRITTVGRWLRRSSLDELPQLINVLRGEMSLVGPRPPLPEEVARYRPDERRRLTMRPGMTGLWQVSGRADLPFSRWVELDLEYMDRWNLSLDVWILLMTVPAVLSGRGAR